MPVDARQKDLQAMIDAAQDGAVIDIPTGIYEGPIAITRPLTLRGVGDVEIVSSGEDPAIRIEKTVGVTVENLKVKAQEKAVVASDITDLILKDLSIENVHAGIHIQRAVEVDVANVIVSGNNQHYSKKGNGIAVYESSEVRVNNSKIQNVQDGLYIEKVQRIEIENNVVMNSRYGTHFMYTKNALATKNEYRDNVTGFMIMMTENLRIDDNVIARQSDLNGYGLLLYDVQNTQLFNNDIQSNRTGVALQKSKGIAIEENTFQMNQTAIEVTNADKGSIVQKNTFTGNILTARSDSKAIALSQNFYDDYVGLDVDEDGIGDTPYVAFSSFGQWMVCQPVYQYFIESPSVVLLTSLDQQINKLEQSVLVDQEPVLRVSVPKKQASGINAFQLISGLMLLVVSLLLWRRGMK